MKHLNVPGFTAEASLYKSSGLYHIHPSRSSNEQVIPQFMGCIGDALADRMTCDQAAGACDMFFALDVRNCLGWF